MKAATQIPGKNEKVSRMFASTEISKNNVTVSKIQKAENAGKKNAGRLRRYGQQSKRKKCSTQTGKNDRRQAAADGICA